MLAQYVLLQRIIINISLIFKTACALLRNDETTLCSVCRWFMKEYQIVTDGYRLFMALNRLTDSENTCFNSGPSQKYVLRQIKAVDFSLPGGICDKSSLWARTTHSSFKGCDALPAQKLDVALLVLYGQILYAGRSFTFALSK